MKKTVQGESKIKQMKAFVVSHKGEEFTATSLAKALGWTKHVTKKIKGEDGKEVDETVMICHNAKAAVRLAKKCGAKVTRALPPSIGSNKPFPFFTVKL
jgi:hypothetical protein